MENKLYKREKYLKRIRPFYEADDIIKVIMGIRRCGKSSLMKTIMQELLGKGVPGKNVIYLDLDQKKYKGLSKPNQLEKVIDALCKGVEGLKYLFIDEVQNVKGYETLVNAYRNDGGYSIFLMGSNSYLLSGELMTKLTGRYIEFEMFPLTFDEYEEMKAFYGIDSNPNGQEELIQYLLEGGFPRSLTLDGMDAKREYVSSVINEIFLKDIKKRLKIRNLEGFNLVKNFVINNFGSMTSIKSIQQGLKNSGIDVSRETVSRYIEALVDAKILYPCERFDMKSKRYLQGERKYYIADTSFYFAANTDNRVNFGPSLENVVYFYAKSFGYSISVGRVGRLECDFILRDPQMDYSYVQVAYTIYNTSDKAAEDKLQQRQYRPFFLIRDNYAKYLLTMDYLLQKKDGIKHENLQNFMKNQQQFD